MFEVYLIIKQFVVYLEIHSFLKKMIKRHIQKSMVTLFFNFYITFDSSSYLKIFYD